MKKKILVCMIAAAVLLGSCGKEEGNSFSTENPGVEAEGEISSAETPGAETEDTENTTENVAEGTETEEQ